MEVDSAYSSSRVELVNLCPIIVSVLSANELRCQQHAVAVLLVCERQKADTNSSKRRCCPNCHVGATKHATRCQPATIILGVRWSIRGSYKSPFVGFNLAIISIPLTLIFLEHKMLLLTFGYSWLSLLLLLVIDYSESACVFINVNYIIIVQTRFPRDSCIKLTACVTRFVEMKLKCL